MPAAMKAKKFSSILIASRGEIALRVMRTAKCMGIATVAVYSDVDAHAPHVRAADRAVRIGGALPRASYLNIEAIIAAAKSSGAEAVHPGYGFLAENEDFAQAVIDAGLVWVGPPPKAILEMGNKAGAKRLMNAARVPCIPGYHETDQSDAALSKAAQAIGTPLMIKAAAGGGGRGMRLVNALEDFAAAITSARSEAQNAFGSSEVILEKAVFEPRHVEVQVFADTHGNVVHLGERDCSVQRRHQKLIEEAPSPAVNPQLRRRMGAMAVAAARVVGYVGAGTIECLLDGEGNFYFMEMNTRLQVEHPVTEALTGFDLVEWQLRVAMGEALPVTDQEDILRRFESGGHAIEVRLCAEDPAQHFLPQSGRVLAWQPAPGVRIDAALEAGQGIPPFYDSMLAKVIAHTAASNTGDHSAQPNTRDTAREKLASALEATVLLGFASNKSFLAACLTNPRFAAGQATTAFIAQEGDKLITPVREDAPPLLATAVYAWRAGRNAGARSPLAMTFDVPLRLEIDQMVYAIGLKPLGDKGFRVVHAGKAHEYWLSGQRPNTIALVSAAGAQTVHLAFSETRDPLAGEAQWRGRRYVLRDLTLSAAPSSSAAARDGAVKAPMAGRVIAVHVKAGDAVVKGAPLLVLEAMKMEHVVMAGSAGAVAEMVVESGAQVALGQVLARLS